MKKTFKKAFILFMCLFAFMIGTKAETFDEVVDKIIQDGVKVDMTHYDRSSLSSAVYTEINNIFMPLTNPMSSASVGKCTEEYCSVYFDYFDEGTGNHSGREATVPIKFYGLYLEQEFFFLNVGEEVTLKYKYLDKNLHAKSITLDQVYEGYSSEENTNVQINGLKVKPLKKGIFIVNLQFNDSEDNWYHLDAKIVCGAQDVIDSKLSNLTKFTSDVSWNNYRGHIGATEANLIEYVFPDFYSYETDTQTACVSDDNCENNLVYNIDFKMIIDGHEYTFKKNNVAVTEVGFVFNEYNVNFDLNENETHQIDFTSYSKNVVWTSLDTSVVKVSQSGLLTAVADGATLIKINYGGTQNRYAIVRVRTSADTVKKHLQSIKNSIIAKNSKLSIKTVKTIDKEYLYDFAANVIYDLFEEFEDVDNITYATDFSDDYSTITVKMGYGFFWELDDTFEYTSYCRYSDEVDGLDCGVEFTLPIEFEDDRPGFDSTLENKAKSLLNKLDFSKEYPSYLNKTIDDYLNYKNDDERYEAFYGAFMEGANLNSLIPNNDGFELKLDQRAGGMDYGSAMAAGYACIYKNDVLYAVSKDALRLRQVMQVPRPTSNTESVIISSIESAVKKALNISNATVKASKTSEKDIYNIKITISGGATAGMSSGVLNITPTLLSATPLSSSDKTIELKTYIEYVDAKDVEVNSIALTGVVEPKEGAAPETSNIKISTAGVTVKEIKWIDEATGKVLSSTDKFVSKKRYILVVIFEPKSGYVMAEDIAEGKITSNVKYLKAEYVSSGPDVRLHYEAKAKDGSAAITTTPTIKVANGNENTLNLSWGYVANANGFKILRSDKKKGKYKEIANIVANEYVDKGLTYGKTYYYKVTAYNEKGSKTSAIVSGKTVPNKVENLKITSVGTNNVKLTWDKVGVTGYEVYMGSKKVTTISKSGTLTYNKKKLKANTTYKFKVRAYKKVGSKKVYGPFSEVVSVKTAPNKPSISLSAKDYKTLNVKLKSVKGATKYVIEMSTDKKTYVVVEELGASGTYAKTDLTPGKTYYFRAKVCNSNNYCSGYSKVVSKKVVPSTPTLASVKSIITKEVVVSVNKQEGAVGYEIYRSTKKKKGYKLVTTLTSETDPLEYVNATAKGKTYYYKVRTYVLNGTTKVYSSYSSVKKIKSK
ncbi:MAG: fibronectin type III domain-containing protein [Bacilli bacterium]|nr:fibronectin type III domain-containing protein [Bacilli bacterium]